MTKMTKVTKKELDELICKDDGTVTYGTFGDGIMTIGDMINAIVKESLADVMKKTDEVPQPQPKKGIKGISILDFFERYRIEPRYQAFESRLSKKGRECSHTWMVIFDKKEGRYLREEGSTRKYKFFLNTDEILDFLREKAKKQEEDKE